MTHHGDLIFDLGLHKGMDAQLAQLALKARHTPAQKARLAACGDRPAMAKGLTLKDMAFAIGVYR